MEEEGGGWHLDASRGKRSSLVAILLLWPFKVIKTRMQLRNSSYMFELGEILGRGLPSSDLKDTANTARLQNSFMQILSTFQRGWRGK